LAALGWSRCRHPPASLATISPTSAPPSNRAHQSLSPTTWPLPGCISYISQVGQRMFNTSLRRVARSCPNASLSPLRSSTPTSNATTITATFTTHSHQRRNSSSKPPVPPNNGQPPIPTASVKQVGAPRSNTDKRPGAESRLAKRKSTKGEKVEVKSSGKKDDVQLYSNEWTRSLPSVPSTQHLNPKGKNARQHRAPPSWLTRALQMSTLHPSSAPTVLSP